MSSSRKKAAEQKPEQVVPLEFAHLSAMADIPTQTPSDASQEKTTSKKKRKRRKSDDGPYSRRSQKSKKSKTDTKPTTILQLRADNSLTVKDGEEEVQKKTAVILRTTPLRVKEGTKKLVQEIFSEHQSKIKTDRPIAEITKKSATGTPLQVRTPGKSLLSLRSKNGIFYGFSNAPDSSLESPQRSLDPSFSSTSPANNVKANPHHIKHVRTFITPESLRLADEEIEANAGQRSMSQNAVMAASGVPAKKASAPRYAKAAKLSSDELRWEWLHLIAHYVLAKRAQTEHNLGLGTFHANTEMMGAELTLRPLAKLFPQGFWVDVKAHFIPGQQILTKIEYTITTDDFVLPFEFNAQQKRQPDIYNLSYIDALINTFKDIKAAAEEIPSDNEDDDMPVIVRKKVNFADLEDDEEKAGDENEDAVNWSLPKVGCQGLFYKMSTSEKISEADFKPFSPFKKLKVKEEQAGVVNEDKPEQSSAKAGGQQLFSKADPFEKVSEADFKPFSPLKKSK